MPLASISARTRCTASARPSVARNRSRSVDTAPPNGRSSSRPAGLRPAAVGRRGRPEHAGDSRKVNLVSSHDTSLPGGVRRPRRPSAGQVRRNLGVDREVIRGDRSTDCAPPAADPAGAAARGPGPGAVPGAPRRRHRGGTRSGRRAHRDRRGGPPARASSPCWPAAPRTTGRSAPSPTPPPPSCGPWPPRPVTRPLAGRGLDPGQARAVALFGEWSPARGPGRVRRPAAA